VSDDRRTSARLPASLVAELDGGGGQAKIAITRDVGATGLLVYTRAQVAVGQTVTLKVSLAERGTRTLAGKVVREEALSPDESTLWRTRVAIQCDEQDAVLAEIYAALTEK
jgi:hypothetical protein